jgi:hypothetical protein
VPIELGVWRLDAAGPRRLAPTPLANEARLEKIIESDPSILGLGPLLVVGRQVATAYGKYIDLLALDAEGNVAVVELKRDRTPRDVVAQALDYGSWIVDLGYEEIVEIHAAYTDEGDLSDAFTETFGQVLPEELNASHQLVVVASELDPSTERIVGYLERLSVPVNAVFFRYLKDGDHEYLMRSWLRDPGEVEARAPARARKQAAWNGQDFYVSFGEGEHRHWTDAVRYGFVSGGQGKWFSQLLKNLMPGKRVFAYVPQTGYVGVGTVIDEAVPVREFTVEVDGQTLPILEAPREAPEMEVNSESDELSEWLVRVAWIKTVPRERAFREKGLFANQATACKLRDQRTIERVTQAFGIQDE